jgi:hypothetical protein
VYFSVSILWKETKKHFLHFSLQRSESSDSLSAPLFREEETSKEYIPMKGYGGIDPPGLAAPNGNGRTLGSRLQKRHELIIARKFIVDIVCALALTGIVLMMIETEIYLFYYDDNTDKVAFGFKLAISISTVFLLIGICVNYNIELQIKALDAGLKDWHSAITNSTLLHLFLELFVCAVHPFPEDIKITYYAPDGSSRRVSVDAILSILMMSRLYLIAKFIVVHSSLLTDTSTSSIGALSKIKINTVFVFKAAMTNHPSRLLISVMLTTFLVNTWAMRTCENYYLGRSNPSSYLEVMWLIATTFLTVGYGDRIPQSYCGRYISICTGVMGVGTTALLVAVLARKLEQTRPERYVFNMVRRIQIEKRRKTAASNVIKAVLHIWMVKKYSNGDKGLRRKYQDDLKTATRQFRQAKLEKAHVGELNVGIIEVSESVCRLNDTVEDVEHKVNEIQKRTDLFEKRFSNIENKLEEIKSILMKR